jgi:serine/threonine-protein kinase
MAFAWLAVIGPDARAQSPEAEALFRSGRTQIKAGKLAAGCDKLAASERLESSVGTLLNLGDCREKLGRLASAWAAFRKAEAMARRTGGDDRRQAEAARRATLLEPRLSHLVIDVADRADGEVVRRDGEIVDEAEWNTPLPVDPGRTAITAEAPGREAWRMTVAIEAGAQRRLVQVPRLAVVEPVAAEPAAPWPPPRPEVVRLHAPPPPPRTWTAIRGISAALAVAGAGALGTGLYFGVHANDLADRADARCPGSVCNDPDGLRLNDQARTAATRANVLYIAGGAALAGAAVLWLVGAPGEVAVVPIATSASAGGRVGLAMTGRF